jgi:hypothetical protein
MLLLHTYIGNVPAAGLFRRRSRYSKRCDYSLRGSIRSGADMERLNIKRITTSVTRTPGKIGAKIGAGLIIATICGAVSLAAGLMKVTAADRLVDGGYDQAIAVASAQYEPVVTLIGGLRLATHSSVNGPMLPTAATEHAWLTRPVLQGEALHLDPVAGSAIGSVIGSSVGARFAIASVDSVQTLEVIDISEISPDQIRGATLTDIPGKLLLVSCKIVNETKSPGAKADRTEVVRFIVDGDITHPVRLPRGL